MTKYTFVRTYTNAIPTTDGLFNWDPNLHVFSILLISAQLYLNYLATGDMSFVITSSDTNFSIQVLLAAQSFSYIDGTIGSWSITPSSIQYFLRGVQQSENPLILGNQYTIQFLIGAGTPGANIPAETPSLIWSPGNPISPVPYGMIVSANSSDVWAYYQSLDSNENQSVRTLYVDDSYGALVVNTTSPNFNFRVKLEGWKTNAVLSIIDDTFLHNLTGLDNVTINNDIGSTQPCLQFADETVAGVPVTKARQIVLNNVTLNNNSGHVSCRFAVFGVNQCYLIHNNCTLFTTTSTVILYDLNLNGVTPASHYFVYFYNSFNVSNSDNLIVTVVNVTCQINVDSTFDFPKQVDARIGNYVYVDTAALTSYDDAAARPFLAEPTNTGLRSVGAAISTMKKAINLVIFRPGESSNSYPIYNNFLDAVLVLNDLEGDLVIQIDDSLTNPVILPAAANLNNRISLESIHDELVNVNLPDITITNLKSAKNIIFNCQNVANPCFSLLGEIITFTNCHFVLNASSPVLPAAIEVHNDSGVNTAVTFDIDCDLDNTSASLSPVIAFIDPGNNAINFFNRSNANSARIMIKNAACNLSINFDSSSSVDVQTGDGFPGSATYTMLSNANRELYNQITFPDLDPTPAYPGNPSVSSSLNTLKSNISVVVLDTSSGTNAFPIYNNWTDVYSLLNNIRGNLRVLLANDNTIVSGDGKNRLILESLTGLPIDLTFAADNVLTNLKEAHNIAFHFNATGSHNMTWNVLENGCKFYDCTLKAEASTHFCCQISVDQYIDFFNVTMQSAAAGYLFQTVGNVSWNTLILNKTTMVGNCIFNDATAFCRFETDCSLDAVVDGVIIKNSGTLNYLLVDNALHVSYDDTKVTPPTLSATTVQDAIDKLKPTIAYLSPAYGQAISLSQQIILLTNAGQNYPVNLTGFASVSPVNFAVDNNSQLVYTGSTRRLFNVSCTVTFGYTNGVASNPTGVLSIRVNGSDAVILTSIAPTFAYTVQESGCLTGLISLSTNDYLELVVQNQTEAATRAVVSNVYFMASSFS